jgi:hypothetical protein
MASWTLVAGGSAAALFLAAATLMFRSVTTLPLRLGALALGLFGVLGFLDLLVSRIVLGPQDLALISVLRRRRFPRTAFASAKVAGGQVCLERHEGGWLVLPSTGHNALGVRNTVHAWLRATPDTTAAGADRSRSHAG